MKIISICSLKGGTGKTTIAANLSLALKNSGKKVLVIDLDPNNNLTDYLCRDYESARIQNSNAYEFLTRKRPIDLCIHESMASGMSIIPATIALHNASSEMSSDPTGLMSIYSEIKALGKRFDFCVIDTAPSRDYTTQAGIYAADHVIIPINYSRWSVQAVSLMINEVTRASQIHHRMYKRHKLTHIVPSCVTVSEDEKIRSNEIFPYEKVTIHKKGTLRSCADKGTELPENSDPAEEFKKLARRFM